MTETEFRNYQRLKTKLEKEIAVAKGVLGFQEVPDDVWADEERRLEWIRADRAQWNHNNTRLARLQRIYDKCFPPKAWVIGEIEAFFQREEGPLY